MGGKVKQRTKGNTKPSSSDRAAQLLSRDGPTGFIGFGNTATDTTNTTNTMLQFVPSTVDADAAVHVDFQVVMKKLTKRDAVTRLKAVQEFGELCKTSAMDVVLGVLPYWPRLYIKLAMDIDHRVREATHNAMTQLSCRVGRNLAPHLKSVMAVWFCSQCDSYSTVATAAQKAFSLSFTENKQIGVLEFCKKEIVEYLMVNLTKQTADSLSDPEVIEEKDRVAKFIRVISSSLQAFGKFLSTVSCEVNTELKPHSQQLMSEKKFWKYGRHKSPHVRSSFYQLITVYCQILPDLLGSFASSVCPIVLGAIDEADSSVSGSLWDAVLNVLDIIEDCWQHVNIEKAVLPKFWQFLSHAAFGNANVVMINVLPFLSKLPDQVISPSSGFTNKLFDKLNEGLNQRKVQQSASEYKSAVSAFMDCVSYIISPRNWKIDVNENEINKVRLYVMDQVINLVGESFSPKSTLSSTTLYQRLHDLLRILTNMNDLDIHFWESFDKLLVSKLSENNDKETFYHIVKCLSCLKSPHSKSAIRGVPKVRFKELAEEPTAPNDSDHLPGQERSPTVDIMMLHGGKLVITVKKCLRTCLGSVTMSYSEVHLMTFIQLLKVFYSPAVVEDLLNTGVMETGTTIPAEQCNTQCINKLLLTLLQREEYNEKWMILIVQLLFVFLVHLDQDDQTSILITVLHTNSSSKFLYFITNELSQNDLITKLSEVHGLDIGERYVDHLKTCFDTRNKDDYVWQMFHLAFSHMQLSDFLFSKEMINNVFEMLYGNLIVENVDIHLRENVFQIVEKFVHNIGLATAKFGRLFGALSKVALVIFEMRLDNCTLCSSLVTCCETLVEAAREDKEWRDELLRQITHVLKKYLNSDEQTTFEKLSIFTETAVDLLQELTLRDSCQYLAALKQVTPFDTHWNDLRFTTSQQSLGLIFLFLENRLTFIEPVSVKPARKVDHFSPHEKISFFIVNALVLVLGDENEALLGLEEKWIFTTVMELLWMRECLQLTSSSNEQNSFISKYNAKLDPILNRFTTSQNDLFLQALFDNAHSRGDIWALSLVSYSRENSSTKLLFDSFLMKCQNSEPRQSVLHTFQSLLTEESSIFNLKIVVEIFREKWNENINANLITEIFCCTLIASAFRKWLYLSGNDEVASLECRLTLIEILEVIRTRKVTMEHHLLCCCSMNDVAMSVVSLNMNLMQIFEMAVRNFPNELNAGIWDMILCTMLEWLQSCVDSDIKILHVSALSNQLFDLINAVCIVLCGQQTTSPEQFDSGQYVSDVEGQLPLSGAQLIQKLTIEWREFFSNSVCGNLLKIFVLIADTDVSKDPLLFAMFHYLGDSLSSPCSYLTVDNLKENTIGSNNQPWSTMFITKFLPYLESSFSSSQMTSYRLLLKVIPDFAANTKPKKCVEKEDSDDDDISSAPPEEILSIIINNQHKLSRLFSEAQILFGETMTITDDEDALHITRSYLLAWKLLLSYFVQSCEEYRVQYAVFFKRSNHLQDLLEVLFRLLPKKKPNVDLDDFIGHRLSEKRILDEDFVHCLAFNTYYDLLLTLPALVRRWWNNLDKTKAAIVERYTTLNISPSLCDKELQNVQKTAVSSENMFIVTRSSTREVIAYYKIDEISIELIVGLSSSHPLGAVTVNCGKRVGVKINQWRLWMMQLTTFLMHQNGSIVEGLMLWKRNVDKKFEGVEDCLICFSVIHGSNYSLPKLVCRTCKKKFHSACLYRWFSTSQNSTCPICRNLF